MEVNEIRKTLQLIFDHKSHYLSYNRPVEPMDRITLAMEVFKGEFPQLDWIGVYLISHERREMILGPFIGEPLERVRFPLSTLSEPQGYWQNADGFGWNGFLGGKWLGRLVCHGSISEENRSQKHLISLLGSFMDSWWGDCDRSLPFDGLPRFS
jgi:hypothetical protein